ncbi:hypothetical protein CLIM01_02931 [Colletotrichum limetticola]|uniref:Uncharacterized protein n=1 Tax=Colletotrichum limetticola TaxID=1209924 RepID=A0ABQ9Q7N0_9PEZI|nr:hypothetical protein CLIM01_02931 [Colletotrichum limetticola]
MGDISATPDTGSRPPMAPLPGIVVCSSSSTPRPGRNGRGTIIADTTFRLQHPSTTNHANLDSFSLKVCRLFFPFPTRRKRGQQPSILSSHPGSDWEPRHPKFFSAQNPRLWNPTVRPSVIREVRRRSRS